MKKEEVVSLLVEHSKIVHFGVEQNTLYDRLSNEEVRQFITSIVHKLPSYSESIVEETNYYCLDVLEPQDKEMMLSLKTKELFKLHITNVINKEQSVLLILYLIIEFMDKYKTNITKELSKASKYLLSYIIPSTTLLYREIEYNPVQGETKPIKDSYIRIQQLVTFIPTRKTIQKFSNYLYTFKNH